MRQFCENQIKDINEVHKSRRSIIIPDTDLMFWDVTGNRHEKSENKKMN